MEFNTEIWKRHDDRREGRGLLPDAHLPYIHEEPIIRLGKEKELLWQRTLPNSEENLLITSTEVFGITQTNAQVQRDLFVNEVNPEILHEVVRGEFDADEARLGHRRDWIPQHSAITA